MGLLPLFSTFTFVNLTFFFIALITLIPLLWHLSDNNSIMITSPFIKDGGSDRIEEGEKHLFMVGVLAFAFLYICDGHVG